jgi:hypothetical protein
VASLSNAVYAPGSTTVNGIALQDFAGTSPLLGEAGLTLASVGAGVEVIARWRVIVNTPLPPATTIETAATVRWDEVGEIAVVAQPVRVRSTSALPIIEPELPFSVLGAVAAPTRSSALARSEIGSFEPAYIELRQAIPVITNGRSNGINGGAGNESGDGSIAGALPAIEHVQLAPGNDLSGPAAAAPIVFLELPDEQLRWTVQYLEQTRVGGLVAHLLAVRALFPDRVGGGDRLLRARLRGHREMLAELADRLFIKVRLPDFPLEPGDIETPELRASLVALIEELGSAKSERPSVRSGLRLAERLDRDELASLRADLAPAQPGTAAPWAALAQLMGTTLERDGGCLGDFSGYRNLLARELAARKGLGPAEFQASLREPVANELDTTRESLVRVLSEQQRVLN